jgi:hypothetical protein
VVARLISEPEGFVISGVNAGTVDRALLNNLITTNYPQSLQANADVVILIGQGDSFDIAMHGCLHVL